MPIKHYQMAGVLAVFLAIMPNITWVLYLPVMVIFSMYAMYLTKISFFHLLILMSLLGVILLLSILMPNTTKYNLLFFLIVLYSLAFSNLIRDVRFLHFVLDFGSYFMLLTIIIGAVFSVGSILQSRPDFDLHLLGFLRQRGFYSEPSNLGYWSAWLAYLSLITKRYRSLFLYLVAIFLASSTGALLFFATLLLTRIQKLTKGDVFLMVVFAAVIFLFLFDQIVGKFSIADTASLILRMENAELSIDFIQNNFPYPAGFGPMLLDSVEHVGITSFILLLPKAFGLMVIFMLPLIWRLRSAPLTILPILLISAVVGNFWETPILIALFYFTLYNRTNRPLFRSRVGATSVP